MRFSKVIFTVLCIALIPAAASAVTMSEIRIDQGGTDYDEYFELCGYGGESLNGLTYIVIGDGAEELGSGVIESVTDLTGYMIPVGCYFLAVESTWTGTCGGTPDLVTTLDFENSDNVTHMLVSGFTGALGDDIDIDDDGNIDNAPWDAVIDCVSLVEALVPEFTEWYYCGDILGPDGSYVPAHAVVCDGYWNIGQFTFCEWDTPGESNYNMCEAVSLEETTFGDVKALFR